jgi:hypothetical protein
MITPFSANPVGTTVLSVVGTRLRSPLAILVAAALVSFAWLLFATWRMGGRPAEGGHA